LNYQIVISEKATPEDLAAITAPLITYNRQNAPDPNFQNLALLVQNPDGNTIGGLWGRSGYDWLFIDYLAVPEELRRSGIGRSLMQQAEQIAAERQCLGVWLDTFSFQALPFYEKLGYQRFGQLEDYPRGHARYFLQKRIA
jgi:ribosomal protein S18 acetylase RimI-like enzyme